MYISTMGIVWLELVSLLKKETKILKQVPVAVDVQNIDTY